MEEESKGGLSGEWRNSKGGLSGEWKKRVKVA